MRKNKRYFGTRRRWPDSPYAQLQQHSANLKVLTFGGDWLDKMYQQIQSQEFDAHKEQFLGGWNKIQQSGLSGGLRRGEFFTTAGYNPNPQMMLTHRLQRMFDNGLQGKLMFCLEESDEMRTARLRAQAHIWPEFPKGLLDDSYVTHHHRPYHEFDKILVETPDAVVRTPNW